MIVFSVLSLNCQSLASKCDKLVLMIDSLRQYDFEFQAICLQETLLGEEADYSLFQIPGYIAIPRAKTCSHHGGLLVYLNNNYTYELYQPSISLNIWEGLILKIFGNHEKKIYLCNVYRPPRPEDLEEFLQQINIVLSDLNNFSSNILILGDFNIDLLKINDKLLHKTYFANMLSLGLSPAITLPTRVTEVSATLIDHIFTLVGGNNIHSSGIIISDISDHFPYFYSFYFNQTIKSPCNKFKYGRKYNDKNVSKILHSLENIDIINLMTSDNLIQIMIF